MWGNLWSEGGIFRLFRSTGEVIVWPRSPTPIPRSAAPPPSPTRTWISSPKIAELSPSPPPTNLPTVRRTRTKLRRFNSCLELITDNSRVFLPFLRVVELWNENRWSISYVKLRRFSNCALEFGLLVIFQFLTWEYSTFFVFFWVYLISAIIIVLYIGITQYTVSVKLGRLSIGSAKVSRSGIDDLLSSTEGGKHDYDW